jgi:hypothetical protein
MAGEDERYREQRDGPCPRLVWATGDETPAAGIDSGPSETASTPGHPRRWWYRRENRRPLETLRRTVLSVL